MRRPRRVGRTRRSGRSPRYEVVRWACSSFLVIDPAVLEFKLKNGQPEDQQEQHPGHRGGVTHLEVSKRAIEQLVGVVEGRVHGSALGHDVGLRKNLEGADQAHDKVEENVW